jgi:hypothetical protein
MGCLSRRLPACPHVQGTTFCGVKAEYALRRTTVLLAVCDAVAERYPFAAGTKGRENLDALKGWLGANNEEVVVVRFTIFGISLLSDGRNELVA